MSGTARFAWEPTPEYVERANVTRLMRRHGIESVAELRRRSIEDIEWYWQAAVEDLDLRFAKPYEQIVDRSGGPQWSTWFNGGQVNIAEACVDRWADDQASAQRVALIAEAEDGTVREFSYANLRVEVDALAHGLRALGVKRGDAVGVFMPMTAEAVIAAYAICKLGAIYLPIFSGFAASAVVSRLQDAEAKVLITADGTWRKGKQGQLKPIADEAAAAAGVEHLIVLNHMGLDVTANPRDKDWEAVTGPYRGTRFETEQTASEDVFMVAYTSGTTGKPKGAVHVHGGFLVKIASEVAYQTDTSAGDVFYWVTDMGWIMGPLAMVGSHALGATMVMYEGSPDFPDPGRIWASVERHRVTMLGVSPTLIRALRGQGEQWPAKYDLSSLRILGSTGEPWNEQPYRWLMRVTGGGIPIINLSGGTEVGACFLSPFPVEPIKACSLGGPSLGMDMDVFDAEGNSLRGEVGELVCKQPWPGMTRGVWGDRQRFLDSYWSMYPDVWRHGDWALVDEDGEWFLYGRSDEAINVAGKRLGPAEVEGVLVADPRVREAATVGVPHETKGEAVWCFVVAPGEAPGSAIEQELAEAVASELGRPFKPSRVIVVPELPKTRSAKILRRAIRAVAIGEDPGDLTSAENPDSIDGIREALRASS